MLNGNTVATLTFNQFHGGNQHNQNASMFNQLYPQQQRDNSSLASRGRIHPIPTVVSS